MSSGGFRDRSRPWCQVEALMHYCVVVQANGKELDYLRGEAYRVSRDAKSDWYAEPRKLGTAFCFEDANARTVLCDMRQGKRYLRYRASEHLKLSW